MLSKVNYIYAKPYPRPIEFYFVKLKFAICRNKINYILIDWVLQFEMTLSIDSGWLNLENSR